MSNMKQAETTLDNVIDNNQPTVSIFIFNPKCNRSTHFGDVYWSVHIDVGYIEKFLNKTVHT